MTGPSGARAVARCDRLGRFSDLPDQLFRPYLGPAHEAAIDQVMQWMAEAGLSARLDPAGNVIGRYEGRRAGAKALMIGSHIDSVRDAGRYDGPLGVMLGIECVALLARDGRRLPFALEVIAFGDEEGSRFPSAMLCSRAVAGTLAPRDLDLPGLDAALADAELDAARFLEARRQPADLLGYLEAHIEQGPVLDAEGLALATVTGIAAQKRFELTLDGVAGHAGTTAMALRHDALAGAAEAILAAERIAASSAGDLVATVGRLIVEPGAANVVPGRVRFTLDVRAGREDARDRAADAIIGAIETIAERRGLGFDRRLVHDLPAASCDTGLSRLLADAVEAVTGTRRTLVSGAGHDAMALAGLTPTAMLFIRCADGISHNPRESVRPQDAELALQAMLGLIERLSAFHDG